METFDTSGNITYAAEAIIANVLVIASLEAISALGKVFVKVATDSKKKWQGRW
jgi:acyl CoA:acetate/3-ketoacid CoA transferase